MIKNVSTDTVVLQQPFTCRFFCLCRGTYGSTFALLLSNVLQMSTTFSLLTSEEEKKKRLDFHYIYILSPQFHMCNTFFCLSVTFLLQCLKD